MPSAAAQVAEHVDVKAVLAGRQARDFAGHLHVALFLLEDDRAADAAALHRHQHGHGFVDVGVRLVFVFVRRSGHRDTVPTPTSMVQKLKMHSDHRSVLSDMNDSKSGNAATTSPGRRRRATASS